jgi:hypothetical protein
MIADRLVRERTIVREARQVVEVGGRNKVADPVSDHDRWFGHRAPQGRTAD